MTRKSFFGKAVLILLILVLGVGTSLVLLWTGPETNPEEQASAARTVQTIPMRPASRSVAVSAFGTVIPARKVVIRPQVSGQVVSQSEAMAAGGHVSAGQELIRIDAKDYELALAEANSNLEQARFEREVESGRQVIARREWDELRAELDMEEVNRSLVLREPHLRRAEALLEKANNEIEVAELQLSRTVIKAPFNAMVVSEEVEVGQLLNPSSTICELVGSDEFWIQVSVPFSQLKWIQFPEAGKPGAAVQVILDTGTGTSAVWEGHVVRLLSDLDPLGRMARLIVSVADPLGLKAPAQEDFPLLLGSYVEARIEAGQLEDCLTIPRDALREGGFIWAVGADGLLKVVPVEVLWTEKDTVIVANGLQKGDELIVSDMRVALPGMEVVPQRSTAYPELVNLVEGEGGNG